MTDADTPKIDWRCQLGRHHYIRVVDDNPEVRGQTVLLCTRCGKHEDATADRTVGLAGGGRYREVAGRPGQAEVAASFWTAAGACCTRTTLTVHCHGVGVPVVVKFGDQAAQLNTNLRRQSTSWGVGVDRRFGEVGVPVCQASGSPQVGRGSCDGLRWSASGTGSWFPDNGTNPLVTAAGSKRALSC